MTNALSIKNVAKQYTLGSENVVNQSFREMLMGVFSSPLKKFKRLSGTDTEKATFWALKNISFEVQQGEVIGIIGRNGAGKSTLLKILSRITSPTEGEINYRGRLASLLEVGTGFHPELTGRENIFLNGTILGMNRKEITQRLDDIIEFAEIENFLDTPVKRYSSGMHVRLAFSVAAHLNPEILVVDEVLAVGDIIFQQKCLGKLKDTASDGRTVFFVSHNMAAVKNLCTRIIYIKNGQIEYDGDPEQAIARYLSTDKSDSASWRDQQGDYLYLKSITIENTDGVISKLIQYDQATQVSIRLENIDQIGLTTAVRITDAFGNILLTSWDSDSVYEPDKLDVSIKDKTSKNLNCRIPGKLLKPGDYIVTVFVRYINKRGRTRVEEVNLDLRISSENCVISHNRSGMVAPLLDWKIIET